MTKVKKEFKELTNIIEHSYYLSKELSHCIATEILESGFTKIPKGYDIVKIDVKETAKTKLKELNGD